MSVSPPIPRMPSLNALRAFEAAARLGGFTLAAEELNVTPGAVAAQIKTLEEEVGAKLFERHAKGVQLTALGKRVLPDFIVAFDALGQAVRDLRREAAPRRVHIAALPALAQLWLAPRLPIVRRHMREVDISVTAMETPPNLKRVPFDICLFYGAQRLENGIDLGSDEILPVCTPGIANRLKRPGDLRDEACLSDTTWSGDWPSWIDAAMPGMGFAPRGPVFSLYSLAVQETLNGAGVLMARKSLVRPYLESGELIAPFDASVPLNDAISLWQLPGGRQDGTVQGLMKVLAEIDDQDAAIGLQ